MWLEMTRRRLWARDMGALYGNDTTTVSVIRVRGKSGRQRTFSVFELLLSALQIAAVAHAPTAAPIRAEVRLLVVEADIESSGNCEGSGAS